jgi:hypothetical protein
VGFWGGIKTLTEPMPIGIYGPLQGLVSFPETPPDQPAHGLRREAGISFIAMFSVVCQRHRPSCELF